MLIFVSMLLATSTAISIGFRRKFEETISVTCFLFIIILYITGLFGSLSSGVYACIAVSIVSLAFCGFYAIKNKRCFLQRIISPAFICFIIVVLLICVVHHRRVFTLWDEFSHWGLVTKNMYMLDSFGNNPSSTTYFTGYPPATSLFQYLSCKISGGFKDSTLIIAQNILTFSLFMPLFKLTSWKKKSSIFTVLLIAIAIPQIFCFHYFMAIYVDSLLGILFAYIIYCYFTSEKLDSFSITNICMGLFIFPMIKASGTGLAVICIFIIAIDIILNRKHKLSYKSLLSKSAITIIAFVLALLLSKYSWDFYLKATNTGQAWASMSNLTLSNIVDFFTGKGPTYRYDTFKNFVSFVLSKDYFSNTFNMTFMMWTVVSVVLAVVLVHKIPKENILYKRTKNMFIGIFVGYIVYSIGMLFLYLFTFSEYEAKILASIGRYLSTYSLAIILLIAYFYIYYSYKKVIDFPMKRIIIIMSLGVVLFSNGIPLARVTVLTPLIKRDARVKRAPLDPLIDISQTLDTDGKRLYFISQNTSGEDYWVARYNLTPIPINSNGEWSIGTPYSDNDVWTKKTTYEEWITDLSKNYSHVYLYKIDQQFVDEFGSAFKNIEEIKNNSLFKLTMIDGSHKLELVTE